ncbi:MAG: phage tail protein [Lachnospiraceae bacterium]|nr:phage tail protein [Lachnospiraceae bacterium]
MANDWPPKVMIGSFGPYMNFAVTDDFLFTFDNFKRNVEGRWSDHNAILSKKYSEYIGPELSTMTFDILLSAAHRINPRVMLDVLEFEVTQGQVEMLVIGGRRIGNCYYKITKMSEAWNAITNNGVLYECMVTLTVEEY